VRQKRTGDDEGCAADVQHHPVIEFELEKAEHGMHFVVIGPAISLMRFKSRAEARDWCKTHYPGSPITKIGRDASSRVVAVAKGRPT
jgi:hypothetical protein